jgi:hypothetical protein
MRFKLPPGNLIQSGIQRHIGWPKKIQRKVHIVLRYNYSTSSSDMETVDTSQRLAQLRQLMKKHNVDIYSM